MTTKITKADGKPWGENHYEVEIDGQATVIENDRSFYLFSNKEFLEKKDTIVSILNSIVQPQNWRDGRWFAKRDLRQWVEEVVTK